MEKRYIQEYRAKKDYTKGKSCEPRARLNISEITSEKNLTDGFPRHITIKMLGLTDDSK